MHGDFGIWAEGRVISWLFFFFSGAHRKEKDMERIEGKQSVDALASPLGFRPSGEGRGKT